MPKLDLTEATRLALPGTACVSAKTRYSPKHAKSLILRHENQRTSERCAWAGTCVGSLKLILPETMDTMLVKTLWSSNADWKKTATLLSRDSRAAGLMTNPQRQRFRTLLLVPPSPMARARHQYSEPTLHLNRTWSLGRTSSKEPLLRTISLDPSLQDP
jgi:hypothetical protein